MRAWINEAGLPHAPQAISGGVQGDAARRPDIQRVNGRRHGSHDLGITHFERSPAQAWSFRTQEDGDTIRPDQLVQRLSRIGKRHGHEAIAPITQSF